MTRARDLAAFVSNADGDIKFDTDTLFIDSSANRVGIGTTTPDTPLHIEDGDVTVGNSTATGDNKLIFKNTSATLAEIRAADTATGAGALLFTNNGSERMRIDQNGKIGIGTTSPTRTFEVLTTGADPDIAAFGTSADSGQGLKFALATSSDKRTRIQNNTSNAYDMAFEVAGSEYMRILGDTGGITFNGDTAAANALDDYEEGSYTPSFSTGSGGAITIGSVYGKYRKIGGLVYVVAGFTNQTISASSYSGQLVVTLPYTADWVSAERDMTSKVATINFLSTGAYGLHGMVDNVNQVHFYVQGNTVWGTPSYAGNGSNRYFHFSLCYRTT